LTEFEKREKEQEEKKKEKTESIDKNLDERRESRMGTTKQKLEENGM